MIQQEKKSISRLYVRISSLFIGVLFVFAAITLYISVNAANHYALEVNQNMNHDLAAHVAVMMEEFIQDGEINEAGLEDLVHSLMVINPSIEVYLLDTRGKILSYVAPEKVVKLQEVSLEPIKEFIKKSKKKIFYETIPEIRVNQRFFLLQN